MRWVRLGVAILKKILPTNIFTANILLSTMTDKPLKIAYEAKRITHNATGLGNYGRTIVEMLARSAPRSEERRVGKECRL